MAKMTFRQIGELVGVGSVVASLIFVGLEVRQSSIATQAATDAAVADGFRDLNLMMASSPDLARAMTEYAEQPAEAPPADQFLMLSMWRALFHTWSNAHRQDINGTIDPALHSAVVQEISAYAGGTPEAERIEHYRGRQIHLRWAWGSERFVFNPDFQGFMDSILNRPR
jgi:hypothetical protein